jgi:hypothetical protein
MKTNSIQENNQSPPPPPPPAAILIASHIFSPKRLHFLSECLLSLLCQTYQSISIYLSISFDSKELKNLFSTMILQNANILSANQHPTTKIYYYIQLQKTPQMRHIQFLCSEIAKYNVEYMAAMAAPPPISWIFFSDDDDMYSPTRIDIFMERIRYCLIELKTKHIQEEQFIGVYENLIGKDHRQQRHEYWCYCVRFPIMQRFFEKLAPYPDIIDHKCCDIMLAEYFRRMRLDLYYSSIEETLYQYRRDESNDDSIIGTISTLKTKIVRPSNPPDIHDIAMVDYLLDWNDYLHGDGNMNIYFHDTFLRTTTGSSFDSILKHEFLNDYPYLDFIDQSRVEILREYHEKIRKVCFELYDIME